MQQTFIHSLCPVHHVNQVAAEMRVYGSFWVLILRIVWIFSRCIDAGFDVRYLNRYWMFFVVYVSGFDNRIDVLGFYLWFAVFCRTTMNRVHYQSPHTSCSHLISLIERVKHWRRTAEALSINFLHCLQPVVEYAPPLIPPAILNGVMLILLCTVTIRTFMCIFQ